MIIYNKTFPYVYEGKITKDIPGSIGNSSFKTGDAVKVAIAVADWRVADFVKEKIRQWRSAAGGMSVLCDDVQEDYQNQLEHEFLADVKNYDVFVLSADCVRDNQMSYEEAKELVQLTGLKSNSLTQKDIVEGVIHSHNDRVR